MTELETSNEAALEREREIIAEQRKAAERERDIATDQRNTLSEQREAIDNQSDNISEQRELINTQRAYRTSSKKVLQEYEKSLLKQKIETIVSLVCFIPRLTGGVSYISSYRRLDKVLL